MLVDVSHYLVAEKSTTRPQSVVNSVPSAPISLHALELANLATGNSVHQTVEANVESEGK